MKKIICRQVAGFVFAAISALAISEAVGAPLYPNAVLPAPVVINPSFEDGPDLSQFPFYVQVNAVDSSTIPGWTVLAGTVDQIASWTDAHGQRALDLAGTSAGVIQQLVHGFIPGQIYQLSFAIAGNPLAGPSIKSMAVNIGASTEVYAFDITGRGIDDMGWIYQTLNFVAVGEAMTLTFASLTDGIAGAALDDISIVLIPEPSMASLAIVAAITGAWFRRRTR